MWSELYINDPDILSDVTEIAVKKLGYWIERRLREGHSSPRAHARLYLPIYAHLCTCTPIGQRVKSFRNEQSSRGYFGFPVPLVRRSIRTPHGVTRRGNGDHENSGARIDPPSVALEIFPRPPAHSQIVEDFHRFCMVFRARFSSAFHSCSRLYYTSASRDNTCCRSPKVGQINFPRGFLRFDTMPARSFSRTYESPDNTRNSYLCPTAGLRGCGIERRREKRFAANGNDRRGSRGGCHANAN